MRKSKDDLRIGVVGAGGRGNLAWNAHKPGEGSRIVALADPDGYWLERREKETAGGKLFKTKDYQKLLERKDVDAVFVCAPDFLHEEIACAALEAGKSVYLEKPMTITLKGCDKVLATAARTKSKLYLGHNMRHFPAVLKMKELIDSGAIGQLQAVWCRHFIDYGGDAYFKDWHSERKYSTGLLLQKGAHDIDVIHWLAGAFTRRVVGMGRLSVYDKCGRRDDSDPRGYALKRRFSDFWSQENWPPKSQTQMSKRIDIEDHSMIMMQLENGVQASYTQCHYTADSCRNYTFIGDEGRIENVGDHDECEILLYDRRGSEFMRKPDAVFKLRPIGGTHGGADPRIVAEFVSFARGEGKASTCPIAAREAVATGFLGTESLRDGSTPREVPPPNKKILKYFANGQ